MELTIKSSAFDHEGAIPARYTCDDVDVSPALEWAGAPDGTESFALIVDDPDAPDPEAPKMVWVHWVLYNLPADADRLAESPHGKKLPPGARFCPGCGTKVAD